MKFIDCAVIGAGPAGLNASLVLGRARKQIALFDNKTNRNRVTQKSHGFITRDGIKPEEFKELGLNDLKKYSSIHYYEKTVLTITKQSTGLFEIVTSDHTKYLAERVLLATGIQEEFPSILEVREFYGKSLFSCPYCDGWELKDQPLIIISENEDYTLHMTKLVYNWSTDLVIATNGNELSKPFMDELCNKNIRVITEPIRSLQGEEGYLKRVEFHSGLHIERASGFIVPTFFRPNQFLEQLGCELQSNETFVIDDFGRTSEKNIYVAGETTTQGPSSLIIAASQGNKAAIAINSDITDERF
ncbi:Thioredoxin reductase [Bacillus mycoides]|uniref:NAD(P)/FAD-dependent oxidoreductase n=1 Tax=Bacillus mycoides TaxID=1405 RepID=UPI0002FBA10A|nr:NAD(P)/FAD-dependent oxidoreductase [Bacillus mycoides]AIW84893.1 Thioredoxin reductase [Bacillus mycoides]GAE38098.1 putative oxidoreductase [Bacillus mycoides NBRC 101238 = DSM 11821]HDR7595592.1 NAD(P)/FAD-dependent oxidoreductase [Bacillus mycoides]